MRKNINRFAVVFCFALTSVVAHAGPMQHQGAMHAPMEGMMFKLMDANGDGFVSKAEFDTFHDKHFKDVDANHDGKISKEEMEAGHKKMTEQGKAKFEERFKEADANHDGALSREEAAKMPMVAKHFDEIDSNKDGKIMPDELRAAWEKKRHDHGGKDHEQGKSGW